MVLSAIIPAGGEGSRLRTHPNPEIANTPKILIPVPVPDARPGESLVVWCTRKLLDTGVRDVTIVVPAATSTQDIAAQIRHQLRDVQGTWVVTEERVRQGTAMACINGLYALRGSGIKPQNIALVMPDTVLDFAHLAAAETLLENKQAAAVWLCTSNPGKDAQNTELVWVAKTTTTNVTQHQLIETHEGNVPRGRPKDIAAEEVDEIEKLTSVGAVVLPAWVLDRFASTGQTPLDLHREVLPALSEQGELVLCYDIKTPAPDLGTPERLDRYLKERGEL